MHSDKEQGKQGETGNHPVAGASATTWRAPKDQRPVCRDHRCFVPRNVPVHTCGGALLEHVKSISGVVAVFRITMDRGGACILILWQVVFGLKRENVWKLIRDLATAFA